MSDLPIMVEVFIRILEISIWPFLFFLFALLFFTKKGFANFVGRLESVNIFGFAKIKFDKDVKRFYDNHYMNIEIKRLPGEKEINAALNFEEFAKINNIDVDIFIKNLAKEYELVRVTYERSDERTVLMDKKAVGLRVLGLAAIKIRESLARSNSSGEKLAAIMSLQVSPSPIYLNWLYDCIIEERAFVQYHALLAIKAYVKSSNKMCREKIREILERIEKEKSMEWEVSSERAALFNEIKEEAQRGVIQ